MNTLPRMLRALAAPPLALLALVTVVPTARAQDAAAPAAPAAQPVDHAAIDAARAAAKSWLKLIDDGDYEESWSQSASAVQKAVTSADWMTSLKDARGQVDPLGDRTLVDSRNMTDPPGAPPGEYVMLHYRTPASGDRTVTETVVMVKEDGGWKGTGYFIKPN